MRHHPASLTFSKKLIYNCFYYFEGVNLGDEIMKIGRNELCPCKSGKKFKKCHGALQDQPVLLNPNIPLASALNRRMSDSKIKQCIHPEKEKCSVEIIKAHSIQNNRILNRIGRNGELYMVKPAPTPTSFKLGFKTIGRNVATTFTGFCGYHDNLLFEPIEDKEYVGEEQQNFLFAYRTFSFEYHKELEAQNAHKKIADVKPSFVRNESYLGLAQNYELGINDSLRHKGKFDEALTNGEYGVVETVQLVFEGAVGISVSAGFFLEYDINGRVLNDLSLEDEYMRLLMLNVFPQDDRTIVLFSWLKEDAEFYKGFREQLLALKPEEQVQMLNNLIPAYCENVVYNPDYIDEWDDKVKNAYLDVFLTSLTSSYEPAKRLLLRKTPYDLFRSIGI